jgi:hypothetical protein
MAVFRILEGRARPGRVDEIARMFEAQAEAVGGTKEFYSQLPPLLMGTPSIRTYEVVKSLAGGGASDVLDWMNA